MSDEQPKTAWVVVNPEGLIWDPSKRTKVAFSNTGRLFKSVNALKNKLQHAKVYLPRGCRVGRVHIAESFEEEYSVGDFLYNHKKLKTP